MKTLPSSIPEARLAVGLSHFLLAAGRRGLLLAVCFCTLLPEPATAETADGDPALAALRAKRLELAWKKRRVIFNNDGNEPYWRPFIAANPIPNREALLKERTAALAGTDVDAIFYCTTASVGLYTHGTRLGSLRQLDNDGGRTLTKDYIDAGLDPLRVMADFAHGNNMEIFWSFRMNDTHDGSSQPYGPRMFSENEFKKKNPGFLFGAQPAPGDLSAAGKMWSAVNYAVPGVRDYVASVVEEVCQNYDIDGIELDFFRHLIFFKSTAEGTPATAEELKAMSSLIQRIRKITETEGLRRGRPILIAVKVPDSVEFARTVGLDLEHWLKNKWVDLLVPTGYYQLNPWGYSVELGHRHGVPVYASLDDPRVRDPASNALRRASLLCYRGRAMTAWAAGAAGIYLFNSFGAVGPESDLYRELGDPAKLALMDKDYFANDRGEAGRYGIDHRPYRDRQFSMLASDTPSPLAPGTKVAVNFQVSDDFAAARNAGMTPHLTLRLRFNGLDQPSDLDVRLADQPLPRTKRDGEWVEFTVQPSLLRQGFNTAVVQSRDTAKAGLSLTDLQLQVRYVKSP